MSQSKVISKMVAQVTAAEPKVDEVDATGVEVPEQGYSMSDPKFWAPYEKFVQEFLEAHQRPGELNDEQMKLLVQQLSLCFRRYQHLVDKTHKHHAEAIKEVDDCLQTSGVTFPKNTKHLQKAICIYLGLHGKNLDMHKVNSYCAVLEFAEMCEIYPNEFLELVEEYDGKNKMSNINNYLVGKFVVAPRSIGLDAEKIRQLTLATHVELIVEPDGNIDETNTANRYNYWSMNMACEIVSNSYHVSHDIFQVYGAPNSDELLLISDSIRCIEFDANTAWDFHRNVYIVWQTGESIGQFNECWPDTPPSPIKLNPLTIPMFVSDAYKEAYSKLYSANTRLWEEGYGNISSAFETAW